jgi:phosphoribosylanthranilate isomerase
MALKTTLLVNGINNLSDARYCAGMGADMMGFNLDESHADHLTEDAFKEITGWVSGIQLVGEFDETSATKINEKAFNLNLDSIQLNKTYLIDEIRHIEKPVIQKVFINKDTIETELLEMLDLYKEDVAYFLVYSNDFKTIDETNCRLLRDLAKLYKVIIGFGVEKSNLEYILEEINPVGLGLQGSDEIRPGLKTFDELEEIFEALEE